MEWVEGHRTPEELAATRGAREPWVGNRYADEFAGVAASWIEVSQLDVDNAGVICGRADSVQNRLVAISELALEASGKLGEQSAETFCARPAAGMEKITQMIKVLAKGWSRKLSRNPPAASRATSHSRYPRKTPSVLEDMGAAGLEKKVGKRLVGARVAGKNQREV